MIFFLLIMNLNKKEKLLELLLMLITIQIIIISLIFEDDFDYFNSFLDKTFFLLLLNNSTSIIYITKILWLKTLEYWINIFSNLKNDTEYNIFKSHFYITHIIFNFLLYQLAEHSLYQSKLQT